jgi:hypothetical protein
MGHTVQGPTWTVTPLTRTWETGRRERGRIGHAIRYLADAIYNIMNYLV